MLVFSMTARAPRDCDDSALWQSSHFPCPRVPRWHAACFSRVISCRDQTRMSNSPSGRWPGISSKQQTHEDFAREEEAKASSERTFGLVFAAVFLIIGLWPLLHREAVRLWSLGIAVAFLVLAFVAPRTLVPLNRLWMKLGLLLHAIVNPVIMAFLFFTTVTPIALIMRLSGKDPLRLKLDPAARTYWIDRTPPGPAPDTMPRQF